MVYGIYREDEVNTISRGEIVVGDDGEKKRIVHHRHYMKYDYIAMEQISCIYNGDTFLRIELKDGNAKYSWEYAKFGKIATSLSELEDCYRELPMEHHPFGYYFVDEFVYIDNKTAERMKYNVRGGYKKNMVDIANEVQNLYKGRMMVKDVAFEIQNYIFQQLYNETNGEYVLNDGVQVMFDADNGVANCIISDEAFKILADNNIL